MEQKTIGINHLRLGKVRYYDAKKNGLEITDMNAYAFIFVSGDSYVNLFDLTDECPVFERTPYSNTTNDGVSYGTKVRQVFGENKSGKCYLLEPGSVKDLFDTDRVSVEQVKDYMLHSPLFFVDRRRIILDECAFNEKVKLFPTIVSDERKLEKLDQYMKMQESSFKHQI